MTSSTTTMIDITSLEPDTMEKILGYLEKRDFPAAARLNKDWSAATRRVANRHDMRRGRILWANVGWSAEIRNERYLARVVTQSTTTHVWTAAVQTDIFEKQARIYVTPLENCLYRIRVLPDYEEMDALAGAVNVIYPARRDFRDRTGAPATRYNTLYVDTIDLLVDMARVPMMLRYIQAPYLMIRDEELTADHLQVAISCFVRARQGGNHEVPSIFCTVADFRKTLEAVRAVDPGFTVALLDLDCLRAPAASAMDVDEGARSSFHSAEYRRAMQVVRGALVAPRAPLAFGIKKWDEWRVISGPLPGTERKRKARRGRGQALNWFHCINRINYVYTQGKTPPEEIALFGQQ